MFLRQISDKYPEIKSLSTNILIWIWGAGTVPVLGACTYSKIAKYPNMGSANPLICCKIAKYPISESDIFYPKGAAKAKKYPKISSRIWAESLCWGWCYLIAMVNPYDLVHRPVQYLFAMVNW
jgi:hypothetical protein